MNSIAVFLVTIVLPIVSSCEQTWEQYENKCFKVHDQLVSYSEAIDACRANESELAHVMSQNEESFILYHFVRPRYGYTESEMWIGGIRVAKGNEKSAFRWLNGDKFGYSSYVRSCSEHPESRDSTANCVSLDDGTEDEHPGRWCDKDCDNKFKALCEKSADGSDLHFKPKSSALSFEIRSLYRKTDEILEQKYSYESRKGILVTLIGVQLIIIIVMLAVATFQKQLCSCC